MKEKVRRYREENFDNVFETRMRMCESNPNHKNAYMAVDCAIKLGILEKPDRCLGCGAPDSERRVEAHHHDYSMPLDVVWVCSKCHRQLDANKREREGKKRFGRNRGVILVYDGKDICKFDSIAEAAASVQRKPHSVSACLSGKSKTCGGVGWRYEEDEDG
jgi:hypothetical protein